MIPTQSNKISRFLVHTNSSHFVRCRVLTTSTQYSSFSTIPQSKPLLHLAPSRDALTAAQWSPVRPLVVAAAAADGHVHFYDLQVGTGVM